MAAWAPEAIRDLLEQVDLDAEAEDLEEQVKTGKGQKQAARSSAPRSSTRSVARATARTR